MSKSILMVAVAIGLGSAEPAEAQHVEPPTPPASPTVQPPPSVSRPEPPRFEDRNSRPDTGLERDDPLCTARATINRRIVRRCENGARVTEHLRCTQTGQGGTFPNCTYDEACEPAEDSETC